MLSNDGDGKRRLITNSCLLLRATSIFFGRLLNRNKLNRPESAICILSFKLIDTFQMKANEKIRENKNVCVCVRKREERERGGRGESQFIPQRVIFNRETMLQLKSLHSQRRL